MKNDYFSNQLEPSGCKWPEETWFQKRRKIIACPKHLHCTEGCTSVPVKYNGFVLEADQSEKANY